MGNKGSSSENRTVRYPSGNVYVGQMAGSKRSGQGRLSWPDGGEYDGGWLDNLQHGRGRMRFPNGNVYEGNFVKNNPSGQGMLITAVGERIQGNFLCTGRSSNTANAYHEPVVMYQLNVLVSNESSQQSYIGPASLHLSSGLVVLPNMSIAANVPILPYAALAVEGAGLLDQAYQVGNSAPVVAHAIPIPAQMYPYPQEVSKEVSKQDMAPPGVILAQPLMGNVDAQAEHEQFLIDQEEREEYEASLRVDASGQSGIAYGVHDPALVPRQVPKYKGKKVNLADPRNYF